MNPKRCHMRLRGWPSLIAVPVAVIAVLAMLLSQNGFAATFTVNNNCSYTIYPGIYPATYSNGGWTMPPGSSVSFTLAPGWNGRIWGRKGCNGASPAVCTTGSCGGTGLECAGTTGVAGTSLAEFNLDASGTDWYDVSYVDGFDNPIGVVISNGSCVSPNTCTTAPLASCYSGDLADGGADCFSPCTATGNAQYCCAGSYGTPATCDEAGWPAQYQSYVTTIHNSCPNEYAYAYDDNVGLHTCATGANYTVNFCPNGSGSTGGAPPPPPPTEGPYGGTPAAVPGTVMAENYDTGGQGVGYNVTSVNGTANAYRSDGVDLEAASAPATGNDLGWSAAGQWFRYTVNVATTGTYTVTFLVAAESAIGDAFHLSNSAGTNLSGSIAVPDTGAWQTWKTVTATVTLPAGTQTLTLNEDAAGWNIDSMAFVLNSSGGGGTAPGTGSGGDTTYTYGVTDDGTSLVIGFTGTPTCTSVIVSYILNGGGQVNVNMADSGGSFSYAISPVTSGAAETLSYYFTYVQSNGTQFGPTSTYTWTRGSGGGGGTTTEGPYGGTPAAIPGTVMAENYDTGGAGVGYKVTSVNGTANAYRSDGVDLEAATAPATGDDLGWTATGQWFRYTVNVATAGTYKINFLVAAESAIGDAFHISNSAGTNLSGSVAVPDTGGWQDWATVTATVTLPAGTQTLTVNQDAAGWNIDSMAFALESSGGGGSGTEGPYGGTPAAIPGTVLAEKYDTGGAGVGYNVTAVNGTDNGFRSDGVDLETTSAPGGGNNVGWTAAGQWFRYTVSVATAGTYTVTFEVASPAGVTDGLHLSNAAGTNLSGSVNIPATGGWQTWTTVTATVTLPAGQQVLTWNQDNAGYNLYSMAFASGSGGGGTGGGTNGESCAGVSPITVNGKTYNPTWCLEFNGPVGPPSTTATNFDFGNNGGWGNGEAEFYCGYPGMANNPAQCPTTFSTATAPVYVDGNGHLVIQPRNVGGTWISARLNTDPDAAGSGPQLFQYGILEASIQLPDMNPQGIWPAFWALGNNSNAGVVWPTCGETDILEDWSPAVLGGAGDAGENSTIHTMDTGGDGISTRYLFPAGEAVDTAFHTYGQVWSANEIQYFVDNPSAPFATLTPGSLPAGDVWPFNQPFFMVLNVAVGGTLGGSDAGINPGPMIVDYIRYYQ